MQNHIKPSGSMSALAVLFLSIPLTLAAQSAGTITGTVIDQARRGHL